MDSTKIPSLDTVLLWVTFTIERDYVARDAFPPLRAAHAEDTELNSHLFYASQNEATAVLADARAQYVSARKGMKTAYGAYVRSVEQALKNASARRAKFEAPAPVSTYKSDHTEEWRGSKDQFQAMGIRLDGPWPGETGGRKFRGKCLDTKGRKVEVSAYSDLWPGLFVARIQIPDRERKLAEDDEKRAKHRQEAEDFLESMPKSEHDFRLTVVQEVRRWLSVALEYDRTKLHGYSISDEAVENILLSCDAVVEAVMEAEVQFDRARHEQITLMYRRKLAEADKSFQIAMGTLTNISAGVLQENAT